MKQLEDLLSIMAKLRDPKDGCPWDKKQTFKSILPYTLEEAYEVADAIDRGDMEELESELGDLLFQVVFYAQIAKEEDAFDFSDIVRGICKKMLRRHPHVFADDQIDSAEEQTRAWEQHKEAERRQKSASSANTGILADVPITLPGLTRAAKLQKRAASVGFDWPDLTGVMDKIREELDEVQELIDSGADHAAFEDEIGDLLFATVNLARFAKVNPESAIRSTNSKFVGRFGFVEQQLQRQGVNLDDASLDEMDLLWEQAKSKSS